MGILDSMAGSLILICSVFAVVSAGCKTPPYIALRNVEYIPRSEIEVAAHVNCPSTEHKAIYVISTWRNETLVLCSCEEVMVGGYCPEENIGNKIQVNYGAPCYNLSSTPCPPKYNASQSFRYTECFEKFGGILSPQLLVEKNKQLRKTNQDLDKRLSLHVEENEQLRKTNQDLDKRLSLHVEENEQLRKKNEELEQSCKQIELILTTIIGILLLVLICIGCRIYEMGHCSSFLPYISIAIIQQFLKKMCCCGTSKEPQMDNFKEDQTTKIKENKNLLKQDDNISVGIPT
ncbi:uncharacterized protein LOC125674885 isoform X2 [Ostrea edulis]|uniref:uncharacterized protein LOC125674885 isoform X2 n=1 Tax=Ostrea edulis TaxID=37623 RepID=UPI00209617CB|nr:uncharacterized protein LOC125674885 isoform X2 [Ostrea edulis]